MTWLDWRTGEYSGLGKLSLRDSSSQAWWQRQEELSQRAVKCSEWEMPTITGMTFWKGNRAVEGQANLLNEETVGP